jgi:feruloyl-CoA synthase
MATGVAAHEWAPDPFLTDVERRADGTLLLRPRSALGTYPPRLTDTLEHWARAAPDRVLIARRDLHGNWIEMRYRDVLARVQRIAAALHARNLSEQRPILILSGNSIEHFLLGLAAMWAGVPYCPVSPAYSQVSQDLGRLRYVMDDQVGLGQHRFQKYLQSSFTRT